MNCTFGTCNKSGKFALYQLNDNLTKTWRTDLCSHHDSLIAEQNAILKRTHKILEFKEVTE